MHSADSIGGSPAIPGEPDSTDAGGKSGAAAQFSDAIQIEQEKRERHSGDGDDTPDGMAANGAGGFLLTVFSESAHGDGGTKRPAADGTFGKTEYVTVSGDRLAQIAGEHGQSVADALIANPNLREDTPLAAGTVLAFLDETRLALAREMASAADPARLETLVLDEILYATSLASTPEDLLPALQADLLARRPEGEEAFAAIVDSRGAAAVQLWRSQGRTHEIIDRLHDLTDTGDSDALEAEILAIFIAVADATPTPQAIDGQYRMLFVYGPQDQLFFDALDMAEADFRTGHPQYAAAQLAIAYAEHGPAAAAQLLADLAAYGPADPLTAARILIAAEPTVSHIVTHLGFGAWHSWTGNPAGTPAFYIDPSMKEAVFGDLAAVADNASRGPMGAAPVAAIARQVNDQGFHHVSRSIIDGDGIALPLAMLCLGQDPALAATITVAIDALKERVRASVREFAETAYPAAGPAAAWGGLIAQPQVALRRTLEVVGPYGVSLRRELSEDIERLDDDGRQLMRVMLALGENAQDLIGFPSLLAAGGLPGEGRDDEIELVLGSQAAFFEALRSETLRGQESGSAADPYALVGPGRFFARMLANCSRSAPRAFHGFTAADIGSGCGLGTGLSRGLEDCTPQGMTLLDALGLRLRDALALTGIHAGRHGLAGLTRSEITALSPAMRPSAPGARHPGGLMMTALRWHVRAFGVLNLASGVDVLADDAFLRGVASLAAGTPQTAASIPCLESAAAARLVFWGNAVTQVGSGVLTLVAMGEQRGQRVALEAMHVSYLERAGVSTEIARALVDFGSGPMPARVMQALSDHLQLRPGELLAWFGEQDAGLVEGYRYWGLQLLAPDESGRFAVVDSGTSSLPPDSLEDLIRFARNGGLPLPDRRFRRTGWLG
ncbi:MULTISPECIES: hypothetical protein [Rhodomicrobium]|uniref:hypothetical protein n=1 Tax=Rhodomicrobium TaxID=1068 RepID=UPI000F73F9BC|nr:MULTISPECIES: hypothetical protein [Rhodomicrobium]